MDLNKTVKICTYFSNYLHKSNLPKIGSQDYYRQPAILQQLQTATVELLLLPLAINKLGWILGSPKIHSDSAKRNNKEKKYIPKDPNHSLQRES